mmetsp:Transcript_16667/g.29631  ORF Transcript_16667/g.29631 Transcript_16667/m.29631 type:complete len:237 (+) Transcript_16667:1480-2190(+)
MLSRCTILTLARRLRSSPATRTRSDLWPGQRTTPCWSLLAQMAPSTSTACCQRAVGLAATSCGRTPPSPASSCTQTRPQGATPCTWWAQTRCSGRSAAGRRRMSCRPTRHSGRSCCRTRQRASLHQLRSQMHQLQSASTSSRLMATTTSFRATRRRRRVSASLSTTTTSSLVARMAVCSCSMSRRRTRSCRSGTRRMPCRQPTRSWSPGLSWTTSRASSSSWNDRWTSCRIRSNSS